MQSEPSTPTVEHAIGRGSDPQPRPPVLLQAAAPVPQPVRTSPRLPLRLISGHAVAGAVPVDARPRVASSARSSEHGGPLDDDALEAEPYLLPHLRTG